MLRVILVDDEPLARQALRELLENHSSVTMVGEADCVKSAAARIEETKPDAIFLDIRMPGGNGFELLHRSPNPPHVIVVTAHAEYAVEAFNIEAVDFLLKPVAPSRFADAIARLQAACGVAHGESPAYRIRDRICLKTPGRTFITAIDRICLLQADGDFTRISIPGEKPLMICQTLGSYEAILPHPPFLRLNRSLIINTAQIEKIEHLTRDETRISLRNHPETLAVGRKAWESLSESGIID
jgi:two-component system, LytTR family, response regulator